MIYFQARREIDSAVIQSVLFDSKSVWTSLAEFRIETLIEEMKQLANEPDFYSCEVDDILAKGRNKYLKRIKKNKNRLQGHLSP